MPKFRCLSYLVWFGVGKSTICCGIKDASSFFFSFLIHYLIFSNTFFSNNLSLLTKPTKLKPRLYKPKIATIKYTNALTTFGEGLTPIFEYF